MTVLKSCPFCGGEAQIYEGRKGQAGCFEPIFDAGCSECPCRLYDWQDTEAEAADLWNTRTDPERDALQARVDGLVALLQTKRDYVQDCANGFLTYADSGEGFKLMAAEDLARIDAALSQGERS